MNLVIKIPDQKYKWIVDNPQTYTDDLCEAIRNGTPLPKGHGRLIDADALEYTCNSDECGMLTGCNNCQYHIITEYEIDNASTIVEGSDD